MVLSSPSVSVKVVICNDEGMILTIRRSKTAPLIPLAWDLPGGRVDEKESPLESVQRETKEEVGLDIVNIELMYTDLFLDPKGGHTIFMGYKAHPAHQNVILSYEHDTFEWVSKEEFLRRDSTEEMKRLVMKI